MKAKKRIKSITPGSLWEVRDTQTRLYLFVTEYEFFIKQMTQLKIDKNQATDPNSFAHIVSLRPGLILMAVEIVHYSMNSFVIVLANEKKYAVFIKQFMTHTKKIL